MGLPAADTNGIYRVDTIPPPDGEDSAYDAPTKVGELARAEVQDLFAASIAKETGSEPPPQMSGARPKVAAVAIAEPLPRITDEADESSFEPTLHVIVAEARSASPPVLTPPVITPTYLPLTGYMDPHAQPIVRRRFEVAHIVAIVVALGLFGLIASFVV